MCFRKAEKCGACSISGLVAAVEPLCSVLSAPFDLLV